MLSTTGTFAGGLSVVHIVVRNITAMLLVGGGNRWGTLFLVVSWNEIHKEPKNPIPSGSLQWGVFTLFNKYLCMYSVREKSKICQSIRKKHQTGQILKPNWSNPKKCIVDDFTTVNSSQNRQFHFNRL
jgi:hypothetical protein